MVGALTELRRDVEAHVASKTKRMLISDISQSLGYDIPFPEGLKEVQMTEVVRCSPRIFTGGIDFALGRNQEDEIVCLHKESAGPPLTAAQRAAATP